MLAIAQWGNGNLLSPASHGADSSLGGSRIGVVLPERQKKLQSLDPTGGHTVRGDQDTAPPNGLADVANGTQMTQTAEGNSDAGQTQANLANAGIELVLAEPQSRSGDDDGFEVGVDATLGIGTGVQPPPLRANTSPGWIHYSMPGFGFSLDLPKHVFGAENWNQRNGLSLSSNDGKALFAVTAALNTKNATVAEHRKSLLSHHYRNAVLDYVPLRSTWFVLSGTLGSEMFYERVSFSCGRQMYHSWKIVYPVAERTFYDRLVEETHRRYRAGRICT